MRVPTRAAAVALAIVCSVATPAAAQNTNQDLSAQIKELRRLVQQTQAAHHKQIEALEAKIQRLEAKAATPPPPPSPYAAAKPPGYGNVSSFRKGGGISAQVGMTVDAAAGGSTAPDRIIKQGEQGLQIGDHDPNRNGFTLQAAELSLVGAVDPYFDAFANFAILLDEAGDTQFEVEEAWAQTRDLPAGFQVRAGQHYTEFGRANKLHVHQQPFVDQPFIISRMFGGDGQRQVGAYVSWLSPLPWYSEFIVDGQNCNGETMPSFCGADEGVGGFANVINQSRGFDDVVWTGRWLNGFDLTDETSVNVGLSASYGPNRTGPGNNTLIYGTDIYAKWTSPFADKGFPFFAWETEALTRRFEAGDRVTGQRQNLRDWGLYTQALYGFTPNWVAGLRFGYGNGNGDSGNDPNRAARYRISPNITWFPTEFSKLRLQFNHDWSEQLPGAGLSADADPSTGTFGQHTAETIWLQLEIALGSHLAHKF